MAHQCPHEQPEGTTQEPMTDTAICLAIMSTPASYPHIGKKECMSMHDGNGQEYNLIIIHGLHLHRVLRKALLGDKGCTEFSPCLMVCTWACVHACLLFTSYIVDIPCILC